MELLLRDVVVGHDPDSPLQENVNFSVASGQVCCILGPNGCGKTTLVRTMLGATPLLGGSILLNGYDMRNLSAKKIANTVAYVEQRVTPFMAKTVEESVLLGRVAKISPWGGRPKNRDFNVVDNALEMLGISHLADRPVTALSGGQLQLVMIAQAVVQEPRLLILDEPTAALDLGNAVTVIKKIRQLANHGMGVVMITHNPDHAFMTHANVALFMRQSPMLFGPAPEIVTRQNIQAAYGVNVRLVEFTHSNGEIMRMCAPLITRKRHIPKAQGGDIRGL